MEQLLQVGVISSTHGIRGEEKYFLLQTIQIGSEN